MSDKEFVLISLGKGEKFSYAFENPRGALVKCTVTAGKGKIVFLEDGRKVSGPHKLSLDPGDAYYVSLNTDRSPYYAGKCEVVIEGKGSKKSEKNDFVLELPLGKAQQAGRKYITKSRRKVQKQSASKS